MPEPSNSSRYSQKDRKSRAHTQEYNIIESEKRKFEQGRACRRILKSYHANKRSSSRMHNRSGTPSGKQAMKYAENGP